MTDELEQLRKENASLRKTLQGLEDTSKLLVRRDIDLRDAYERLKLFDKEKSEFVSIAAHQLRTPLTVVRFAGGMLADSIGGQLDAKQLDFLEKSRVATEQMFGMIEDLIMVDALDYGNLQLTYAPVAIEPLITEIVDGFTETTKRKSLTLTRNYCAEATIVQADARRLKDVISNLIDNAIKYTPQGGTVTVSTACGARAATITVLDSGIGVPPEERSGLFKKFSRLENAKKVDAQGSGLGLYISKKIMEKHKGDITYSPREPLGSVFTVSVPV